MRDTAPSFQVGDRVNVVRGRSRLPRVGEVRAAFTTRKGARLFAVEWSSGVRVYPARSLVRVARR